MTTIQIEADVSTAQLLHVIEQLPPQEFAAFLAQLLARMRGAALASSATAADGDAPSSADQPTKDNPYLAAAGLFSDDAFAAEVEAYITAQREREREEAARAADA